MTFSRFILPAAACAAIVSPAYADDAGRAAYERFGQAWQEVGAFSASVTGQASGIFQSLLGGASADLTWQRAPESPSGWSVRVKGTNEGTKRYPKRAFEYAVNQQGRMTWLDDETKTRRVNARGKGDASFQAYRQYFEPESLLDRGSISSRLDNAEFFSKGTSTKAGELCDVVQINLGAHQKETWHIARSDGLPRYLIVNLSAAGTLFLTFENVDTTPVAPDFFEIAVPEGWENAAAPRSNTPRPAGETVDIREQEGVPIAVAPDFTVSTPDGDVSLADYKGKVLVLDFWGTWCLPCKKASPALQRIYEQYNPRGVEMIGMAVRERTRERPIQYFEDNGLTFTLGLQADQIAREYGIRSYPTYVIIDANGVLSGKVVGWEEGVSEQKLIDAIEEAIESPRRVPGQ